jgi:hypothetical protein
MKLPPFLVLVVLSLIGAPAVAWAEAIDILDSSFELDAMPPTDLIDGGTRWVQSTAGSGTSSMVVPASPYPNQVGERVGVIGVRDQANSRGTLYQDMSIIEEGTYEVTVGVAKQLNNEPSSLGMYLNFESFGMGGPKVLLGENLFPLETFNNTTLTDVSGTFTIPTGHPALGQFLRLVVNMQGADPGPGGADPRALYNVDNVRVQLARPGNDPVAIPLVQSSFEVKPWTGTTGANGSAGYFRPTAPLFPNQTSDQLGFVTVRNFANSLGALYQDVTTIQPGTYTWKLDAALAPGFEPTSVPLRLNFEGILGNLKTTITNEFAIGTMSNSSLTELVATLNVAEDSELIGRNLRLVILGQGQDAGSNPNIARATYVFDNARLEFEPLVVTVPGDFDNDGDVDGRDFLVWQRGESPDQLSATDLAEWQQAYGGASLSAQVAVPEPTVPALLAILALMGLAHRRPATSL